MTNTLFSTNALANALHQRDLTNDLGWIRAINNWNGRDYDFYFALQNESYRTGESFLLKANHADPALKLLYRKFKFEHLGRLDVSATHYLYNGESGLSGRGGNGGVFLRDLSDNTSRTLFPLLGFLYSLIGIPMIAFGNQQIKVMGIVYLFMPIIMAVFGFIFFCCSFWIRATPRITARRRWTRACHMGLFLHRMARG